MSVLRRQDQQRSGKQNVSNHMAYGTLQGANYVAAYREQAVDMNSAAFATFLQMIYMYPACVKTHFNENPTMLARCHLEFGHGLAIAHSINTAPCFGKQCVSWEIWQQLSCVTECAVATHSMPQPNITGSLRQAQTSIAVDLTRHHPP